MSTDIDSTSAPRTLPPARVRTRIPPSPQPEATRAAEVAPASNQPPSQPATASEEVPASASPGRRKTQRPQRSSTGKAYRQPPAQHRFKPGVSGNPKGRPKGARSLSTLVDMALSKTVTGVIGGRSVKMTSREAMVLRYVEQAMKGDLKSFTVLVKLDPRARETDESAKEAAAVQLSEVYADAFRAYADRRKPAGGEDEQ